MIKYLKQNNVYRLIKRNILGYVFEIYVYMFSVFKNKIKRDTKFIIFSQWRSGSTLLREMFNSHPKIYCDKEILDWDVISPIGLVLNRESFFMESVYWFKLLVPQMMDRMWYKTVAEEEDFLALPMGLKKDFLQKLVDHGYKIIYLKRENILDIAVSFFYARFRKKFHSTSTDKKPKMTVDLVTFLKRTHWLEVCVNAADVLMKEFDHCFVSYEEDLLNSKNHVKIMEKCYNHLWISYYTPNITLKKIIPKDYSQIIKNHEEFMQTISKTSLSKYL